MPAIEQIKVLLAWECNRVALKGQNLTISGAFASGGCLLATKKLVAHSVIGLSIISWK